MPSGFIGVLDFVGYPVGLGTAVHGRGFRGAGRYAHIIQEFLRREQQYRSLEEGKRIARLVQRRVESRTTLFKLEKAYQKRQAEAAMYTALFAEL